MTRKPVERELNQKLLRDEKAVTMGRPFYPHEADDPDLDWLVSNFLCERPSYLPVESGSLPLVLLPYSDPEGEELIDIFEENEVIEELSRPEK